MKNSNDINYIYEKLSSRYPNYSNKKPKAKIYSKAYTSLIGVMLSAQSQDKRTAIACNQSLNASYAALLRILHQRDWLIDKRHRPDHSFNASHADGQQTSDCRYISRNCLRVWCGKSLHIHSERFSVGPVASATCRDADKRLRRHSAWSPLVKQAVRASILNYLQTHIDRDGSGHHRSRTDLAP